MMSQSSQSLWEKGKSACLLLSRAEKREFLLYCLVLLFLPTQLGKHFWPAYSLVSGFRVDYLSPTVYLTDILTGLLFLHVALRLPRLSFRDLLPFLFLLLLLLITIIPSVVPLAGFYSLLKISQMVFFGWYTAAHMGLPLYKRFVPWIFALTVSAEALLALLQVANKGSLGGLFYFFGERAITSLTPGAATTVLNGEVFLRAYATFSHPNVLAGFLLLSMLYLFFKRTSFSVRSAGYIWLSSLLLGTAGMLTTLSRIPIMLWFGFLAIKAWLFIRERRNREASLFTWQVRISALLLLFLSVSAFAPPLFPRFVQTSLKEESIIVRADLTRIALTLISEQPLLGVGLGNFLFHSAKQKPPEMPLFFAVQPVHNIFLLVLAETGIVGFFFFLWFLLRSYRHASIAVKTLLSVVMLLGLFDHYFLTLQQGQLLFAFILGLCWAEKKSKKAKNKKRFTAYKL